MSSITITITGDIHIHYGNTDAGGLLASVLAGAAFEPTGDTKVGDIIDHAFNVGDKVGAAVDETQSTVGEQTVYPEATRENVVNFLNESSQYTWRSASALNKRFGEDNWADAISGLIDDGEVVSKVLRSGEAAYSTN